MAGPLIARAPQHVRDIETLLELKRRYYQAARSSGDAARRCVASELSRYVDQTLEAAGDVDAAAERIRARYYPRAGRVVCAGGEVVVISPTGRSMRSVRCDPIR